MSSFVGSKVIKVWLSLDNPMIPITRLSAPRVCLPLIIGTPLTSTSATVYIGAYSTTELLNASVHK